MQGQLMSKVLVLDSDPQHSSQIKEFCERNNLIAFKVENDRLMSILQKNIDLGAILFSEDYAGSMEESAQIALKIHAVRPELPIILRRMDRATLDDIAPRFKRAFCAAYVVDDLNSLKKIVDEYLFSMVYPNALVRGIAEITESVLSTQFSKLIVVGETPYIIRDKIIFGEVFSLIPLESNWCRGYMMLQTEESPILEILDKYKPSDDGANFRTVNSLLGEITNLVWGAFKNRYVGDAESAGVQIEVPLVVNHKHKYISFGTEAPQLCFAYTLLDEAEGISVRLYQRFIFNLHWAPEDFQEIHRDAAQLVESGELELF